MFTQLIHTPAGWLAAAWTQAGLAALTVPQDSREEALAWLAGQLPPRERQGKEKKRRQPDPACTAGETPAENHPEDCLPENRLPEDCPALLERALVNYFSGLSADFALPVDLFWCTPFQKKILLAIRDIPCGEVRSYSQVAAAAGYPRAVRAAGSVAGLNRTPLVIPCHRVIRQNGGLGGFGGGLAMKKFLLALEAKIKEKQAENSPLHLFPARE